MTSMPARVRPWLVRLSPMAHVPADQPVFWRDAVFLAHIGDRDLLTRRTLRWLGLSAGLMLLLWLAAIALDWLLNPDLTRQADPVWRPFELSASLFWLALVATMLLAAVGDFAALIAAARSMRRDLDGGAWDLLRLTPLRIGQLILAKHAGAQMALWRLTVWIVGLRAALGLMLVLGCLVYAASLLLDRSAPDQALVRMFAGGLALAGAAAAATVLIIEPIWRLRGLTALGLMLSIQRADASHVTLGAVGALIINWLAQLGIILTMTLIGLFAALFSELPVLQALITLGALFGALAAFFGLMRAICLRRAALMAAA